MHLPRGITGFGDLKIPPPPIIAPHDFKADCFAAARIFDAAIVRFVAANQERPCNYHLVEARESQRTFEVLANALFPFIAFRHDDRFIEASWSDTFFPGFRLLTVAELNRPVTNLDLTHLGRSELDQLRHWKPKAFGEIIFNHWD